MPSRTCSRSTARLLATSPGATDPKGTHSGGSTDRATRASGSGRAASRRESRIAVRERASLLDTTVVLVRKMERWIRSVRVGREGLVSSGGRTLRAWRRRRRWRIGARASERNWWDV